MLRLKFKFKSLQTRLNLLAPYARLARVNRPVGTLLLYLPCTWSVLLCSQASSFGLEQLAWMGAGALVMRGAGCTINDYWDRDIDSKVHRTQDRPIANGQVSKPQAIVFLGAQLSVGLAILLQFNTPSILVGMASLPLVIAYPLFKRFTYWPQAFLGLVFNWGALVGATAIVGHVTLPSICLYAAGFFGTLVYDTIYALQDINDDSKVGVKSTAILFGDRVKPIISIFATASVACFGAAGYFSGLGFIYYTISVGGAACHYLWQIYTLKVNDGQDCWKKFVSNCYLGALVSLGIAADILLVPFFM